MIPFPDNNSKTHKKNVKFELWNLDLV
jgi:hypothetical protein